MADCKLIFNPSSNDTWFLYKRVIPGNGDIPVSFWVLGTLHYGVIT